MIAAIDIGNTHIVIGVLDGERVVFAERICTDTKKTELEYAVSIKTVLELYGIERKQLEGTILSSVVPPVTKTIHRAVEKVIPKRVLEVGPGVKNGLDIRIDNPAQLGPDLVVGAVAAIHRYPCPLIVIDMGTATTMLVVNERKQVLGGAILPGVGVALEALIRNTAQLPEIALEPPRHLIGRNTVDCMKSGVLYGNASCLDGMLDRFCEELGGVATVVATGGLAESIIPCCRHTIILDQELLLQGLGLIYRKNS